MPATQRFRRSIVVLGVLAAAVTGFGALAFTPSAAVAAPSSGPSLLSPGDQVSFALPSVQPDFGYQKQGTVVRRTIEVLNDGVDSLGIDSTPLLALSAPFSLVSTTLGVGAIIPPGGRGSIVVEYTAPSAGTDSAQNITLVATDVDRAGTYSRNLAFVGHSLATPRAYFELVTSDGTGRLDFGGVPVGTSVTKIITVRVFGIDPLEFDQRNIQLTVDSAAVRVGIGAASFGNGLVYRPGGSGTFEVTVTPSAAGSFTGTVRVLADVRNGDPETAPVEFSLPFTARATPKPSSTPTATPTSAPTNTTTPTPTPGITNPGGVTGSANGVDGAGAPGSPGVAGSRSSASGAATVALARTGAEPLVGLGIGVLTLLLGLGATMLMLRMVRRSR